MKVEQILLDIKNGFRRLMKPLVHFFAVLHLNPNIITLFSFFLCIAAAFEFTSGRLRSAALLLLLGGFLDVIDGDVARAGNRATRFGALFDSTLDRYADAAIFMGIGYHFVVREMPHSHIQALIFFAVFSAMTGSMLVSYVRARAEALNFECTVGLMQRPERFILLSIGALVSEHWFIAMICLIAILANYTAVQRIYHIWKVEHSDDYKTIIPDIGRE
jgi:CDP-diacylglycerol---glycerol-3-phosphate 3-phosphatidyltransferase